MTTAEFLTVLVASHAAIVSTLSVVYQFKEKQRRLKVKSYLGFVFGPGGSSETMIFIEVANTGHVAAVIYSPYFLLPNKKQLVFPYCEGEHKYPYELQPGHSTKIWINSEGVKNNIRENGFNRKIKVRASVSDATGKVTKSRKKLKVHL